MHGRIRNPNTKIGKPTQSRDEFIQRPTFATKGNPARTVYTTYDQLLDTDRSPNASSKTPAFGGHGSPQTISTDLMRTKYTMDTVPSFSANRVVKPQIATDDDSVSGSELFGGSHGNVQDDSQLQNTEDWRLEDKVVEETRDESTAQIDSELSQISHPPASTPRGTRSADCCYDTTAVATRVADDSDEFDEFDEQVDDTTLISIEEAISSTPISSTFPSTPSDSETRTPATLHPQYSGQDQTLLSSWAADSNEDGLDDASVALFEEFSAMGDTSPAPGVGHLVSSMSAPRSESDLERFANPSLPALVDSDPCTSPQESTKSREDFAVEDQSTSWRRPCTQFKPSSTKVKLNPGAVIITQAATATMEGNVRGNTLTIQASLGGNSPAPPSAPANGTVNGASSQRPECPKDFAPRPFVRPLFPARVSSCSPIQGLTSTHTLLRTCFRIGDALNAGLSSTSHSSAQFPNHLSGTSLSGISPTPHPPRGKETTSPFTAMVLVELYAFVEHSYRANSSQFFRFADLFSPCRPPYLWGEWQGWKSNSVDEADGRAFLGPGAREWKFTEATASGKRKRKSAVVSEGELPRNHYSIDGYGGGRKMCRVVGIVRKHVACDERDALEESRSAVSPMSCMERARMTVLSIWEAEWADVEYVKGIVKA